MILYIKRRLIQGHGQVSDRARRLCMHRQETPQVFFLWAIYTTAWKSTFSGSNSIYNYTIWTASYTKSCNYCFTRTDTHTFMDFKNVVSATKSVSCSSFFLFLFTFYLSTFLAQAARNPPPPKEIYHVVNLSSLHTKPYCESPRTGDVPQTYIHTHIVWPLILSYQYISV